MSNKLFPHKLLLKQQASNRKPVFFPLQIRLIAVLSLLFLTATLSLNALAQTTVIVSPGNLQGWSTADTRPGGAVNFIADATLPSGGIGALQITTDNTNAAKAQFLHAENTPLANVTELSYYTKQISSAFQDGVPSYQLQVYLDGTAATFTNFVYEPYNNNFSITNGVWQQWNVYSGRVWSSRTVNAGGTCSVTNGSGGPPFYTFAQLKTNCPNAVVVGFGVNVGSFNPSYNVETDLADFNGTTYNFELNPTTFLVDDDGVQCSAPFSSTIQAAVNVANPGDIIQVCAGIYPETVSTNKNLVFRGPQATVDPRTGRTDPNAEAVVGIAGGAFNLQVNPGSLTVDGFTLTGANSGNGDGAAMLLIGGSGHQIVNNIFINNQRAAFFDSPNATFSHNRVNSSFGGFFGGGANATIDGNAFTGAYDDGAINTTHQPQSSNYRIINNTFNAPTGNFAVVFNTSAGQVTGNSVTGTSSSAIFIAGGNSNLVVSGNTVTNNTASAVSLSGGFGYPADSRITIISNTLNNNLRGINIGTGANSTTGIEVHFNRIVGNSAFGINNLSTSAVNAENNWWGCNYGPGATGAGCSGTTNGISGTVDANPWLTLTTSASPSALAIGATSTITSRLTVNSDNVETSGSGTVPNGIPASFVGMNGNVTPPNNTTTNGITTTTFTATTFGMGGVNTTIDGQTVNAPVNVNMPCNTVSIPTGQTVATNTQFTVPINVDNTTGRNILSYDFTLTYNPAVVTLVSASTASTLSNGWSITTNNSGGTLVVSGFNTAPLSGAGVLLNLNFVATGGIGTTSNLSFSAFQFNEGVPCVNTTNGMVTVISGTVSGTVTYVNAAGPPSGPPLPVGVPNTTISAAGSIPLSTMTNGSGAYSLSGFGAGPYTITPSKANQVNGISNLDASAVAQHVVGFITLNATQKIAADVSGNGTITSLDAAYIAQYVVSLSNPSFTGTWRFLPASRSYPNVQTSYTGQDYSAILLGEVTGNWNPAGPLRPVLSEQATEPANQAGKVNPKEKPEQVVLVSAPLPQATSNGANFAIPLTTSNTTGEGILGYQFDLIYDSSVIVPQITPCDNTGTISSGLSVVCNPNTPGILKVVLFGTMPINGSGTLLKLNFNAVGTAGMTSPLTLQNFMFNEGAPQNVTTNGQVVIAGPTAAGVSIKGKVLTPLMRGLANARVTLTDAAGESRTVMSNPFGNFAFSDVPAGQTYVLEVNSKRYKFNQQVLPLTDNLTELNLIAVQ